MALASAGGSSTHWILNSMREFSVTTLPPIDKVCTCTSTSTYVLIMKISLTAQIQQQVPQARSTRSELSVKNIRTPPNHEDIEDGPPIQQLVETVIPSSGLNLSKYQARRQRESLHIPRADKTVF